MKKSTYRLIKSIGMFVFLAFFGVFIFLVYTAQRIQQDEAIVNPDANSQGQENMTSNILQNRPVGFKYRNGEENQTDKTT